jgi:Ca2+-binding RTX toxin-like protein
LRWDTRRRFAGDGANLVVGGFGNNSIVTDSGSHTIWGNEGNDALVGGGGSDRYVFGAGDGADIVVALARLKAITSTYEAKPMLLARINGNAMLTLSGGGTVTLAGIMANQVGAGFLI